MKAKKNKRSIQPVRTLKSKQIAKFARTVKFRQMAKPMQAAKPRWTAKYKQAIESEQMLKLGQADRGELAEQIVRIAQMEALFSQCEEAVKQLRQALENDEHSTPDLTSFASVLRALNTDLKELIHNFTPQTLTPQTFPTQSSDLDDLTPSFATLRSAISILEAYYTSPAWRTDFEADEAGLLPPDLKRGVLSEDGIYNLLEEYKRVEEGVKESSSFPELAKSMAGVGVVQEKG